jgi:hypothetical protein
VQSNSAILSDPRVVAVDCFELGDLKDRLYGVLVRVLVNRAREKEKKGPHAHLAGESSGPRRKPRRIQPVLGSPREGRERGERSPDRVFEAFQLAWSWEGWCVTRLTASR